MPTVFANGRSIVHKGDGSTNIAAPPDVCKTPSPAGPVPIPYPNIAKTSDLAAGSQKVEIEGNPVGLESSNLSTSMGDEPGTAGGIISSKNKGKMTWGSSSLDVKVEGKGVARFMDVVQHNGNTFNTAFIEMGQTGFAYGDDFEGPCVICGEPADKHRIHETESIAAKAKQLLEALKNAQKSYFGLQQQRDDLQVELDNLAAQLKTAEEALEKVPAGPLSPEQAIDKTAIEATIKALKVEVKAKGKAIRTLGDRIGQERVHKDQGTGGYMVGVMLCKQHTKTMTFAAMSGQTSLAGFKKAVEQNLGWTLVNDPAAKSDFQAASPGQFSDAGKAATFDQQWSDCASKVGAAESGFNEPGTCAAAKLLTKSKHAPLNLSEMYFSPRVPDHTLIFTYKHITLLRSILNVLTLGVVKLETTRSFGPGTTVPSCNTCKKLLPAALCEQRTC